MGADVSWKGKLGLVAFGLALGLGMLEVALRLVNRSDGVSEFDTVDDLKRAMLAPEPAEVEIQSEAGAPLRSILNPHADDRLIYDLRPNLDVTFQGARVKTNSCGMRNREIKIARDENTYRIALLGDSFAFGWGVAQEESFAGVLEENLNRIGTKKVEVLNLSAPGYSTFQEVTRFKELGLEFDPDAVLVFFVENDFGFPFYVRDIYRPGELLRDLKFAQMINHQTADQRLEEQRMQLLGFDANRALGELSDLSRDRGIPLYLAINPKQNWMELRHKLWILRERRDIRVLPLRKSFMNFVNSRRIPEAALSLPNDPHPSPIKHRLLGDLLTPVFMEAVL